MKNKLEERPKTPSEMKIEEWKAGNKLYEMALKDHTWEKYLKSIGKDRNNSQEKHAL